MTTSLAARPMPDSNIRTDTPHRIELLEAELAATARKLEQTKHLSDQLTQQLLKTEELASDWETKFYDAMEEIETQKQTIEQLSLASNRRRKKGALSNKPHVDPRQKYPLLDLYYNPRTAQFFQPGQYFVVQLWKGNALTWGVAVVAEGNVIVSTGDEKTRVHGFGLQIIGYFVANKHGNFHFTRVYKVRGTEQKEIFRYSLRKAPEEFMYEKTEDGKKEPIIYGVPNQLITAGGPVHTMLMKISESGNPKDGRLNAYKGKALSRSGWGHIMAIGKKSEKIEFLDKGYTYIDSKGQKHKVDYTYYQPTLKDIKSLYNDDENRTKTSRLLKDHFAEIFKDKTPTRKRTMDVFESDSDVDEPPKKKIKTNEHIPIAKQQQNPTPNRSGHTTTSTRQTSMQEAVVVPRRTHGGKSTPAAYQQLSQKADAFAGVDSIPDTQLERSEDEDQDDEEREEQAGDYAQQEDSDAEYEREEQATQNALMQAQQLA